ncbi:XisI protein [Argonema antarcticum]|uniref:XisI protein n=1 Tax=Argonema antarcticum TaxID=2942763 RepID=UPI0020128F72|nr:XisI protein [Argonema antarcticum]MCL1475879.1 XisI protein [Argonema antarcticum A004/B2]
MDIIEDYRKLVKQLLNKYASFFNSDNEVKTQTIFDLENDRYILLSIGWLGGRRVHHCIMHIDIIDFQVWIQENNTDRLIAEELVAAGISPKSIILGLQPPEVRAYTSYGVPDLALSQPFYSNLAHP